MGFGHVLFQTVAATQFYFHGRRFFTEYGWLLHSASYPRPDPFESFDLSDKTYIVTGATSGIGKKVTELLSEAGATVYMISRDEARSNAVRDELRSTTKNENIFSIQADVGVARDVKRAVNEIKSALELNRLSIGESKKEGTRAGERGVDAVICNAGALLASRQLTSEGVETTLATHLIHGTYLLVNEMIPLLEKSEDPRVVVVSSGGMLNAKWPGMDKATSALDPSTYDGQLAYAYAKRGQVLLVNEWSKLASNNMKTKFFSSHPGWVDTPGVAKAYGKLGAWLLSPLRSLYQGSEGIAWLAACPTSPPSTETQSQEQTQPLVSGGFYLDRRIQPQHLTYNSWFGRVFKQYQTFTDNSEEEIKELLNSLASATKDVSDSNAWMLSKSDQSCSSSNK